MHREWWIEQVEDGGQGDYGIMNRKETKKWGWNGVLGAN
jgi:hypothetical protein